NGAVNPEVKTPPIYMRSSWIDEIEASCIFLDDPTVHKENMRLGWGQGTEEHFALEEIAIILEKLFEKFKFENENIFFYGSSAGGFMSAYYSILIKGSTAIINNPQTMVLNYLAPYVKRMLNYSYGINKIEEVPENLIYRLDLVEAMKHYQSVPKRLYYLQNYSHDGDVEKHLNPFLDKLKINEIEFKGLCLINYFNKNLGHNPLSKVTTLKYIHQIIEGKLNMNF